MVDLHGPLGVASVDKHHLCVAGIDHLRVSVKKLLFVTFTPHLGFLQRPDVAEELLDVLLGDAGLQVLYDTLRPLGPGLNIVQQEEIKMR